MMQNSAKGQQEGDWYCYTSKHPYARLLTAGKGGGC